MPRYFIPVSLALASVLLSGCTDSTHSAIDATPTSAEAASTEATPEQAVPARDDDPAVAIIDTVLTEYPTGIITAVDHDLRTGTYDVDVVVDAEVVELTVTTDGQVRVDKHSHDDNDVREAADATVPAAEALRQALDRYPDALMDDLELEEDDGQLQWEIDLDDQNRIDLAELIFPAR